MLRQLYDKAKNKIHGSDEGFGERGYFQQILRRKSLEGVFLFVTSRCNSKCRTCLYAKDLNRPDDLTTEQIIRLSRTAPEFDKLWLSGGEPYLHPDLVEIIEAFHRHNGIGTVNLPTNGLLPDRIERETGRLLERCPGLHVHLDFSLDGFPTTNESVRGVPGGFFKTIESMERVEAAFSDNPRLHMNSITVLTPENRAELHDLSRYLLKKFRTLGFHLSAPARGEVPDPAIKALTREQVAQMHDELRPVLDTSAQRMFGRMRPWQRALAELSFTGIVSYMFKVTEQCFEGPSPWGMRCPAGETTFVIDADGGYRACEMRPRIGNLADHDYDLGAALRSPAMKAEIEAIGGGERANCWCIHSCWIASALKFAPRVLLTEVPKGYFRHRRRSSGPISMESIDMRALEERYGLRRPTAQIDA